MQDMTSLCNALQANRLDPKRAAQSHLVQPSILATTRTLSLLFCLVTIGIDSSRNDPSAYHYVMFMTNLSFYTITSYFMVSAYVTWRTVHQKDFVPWSGMSCYFFLWHTILYELCVVLTLIVTPIYWGLLAKDDLPGIGDRELYLTISMHLFNSVLMWKEIILGKNVFILTHILVLIPIILLYIPYALTLKSITGEWAYFFLNYEDDPVCFTIIVSVIGVYATIAHLALVKLHEWRDSHFVPKTTNLLQG
ncbi:hypothetical protein DSO57_1031854 [Entomophthora muscae]|uniref:Uncharacterized protein n=1 Tax=Entomophthora muscae TaxID=34485 RepID=A0ACC2SPW7_9FUNG|nr:hypothetical protein DSO57_1031854 [Entomophthora muscae]